MAIFFVIAGPSIAASDRILVVYLHPLLGLMDFETSVRDVLTIEVNLIHIPRFQSFTGDDVIWSAKGALIDADSISGKRGHHQPNGTKCNATTE